MPAGLGLPSPARWLPDYVVVLEGQAKPPFRGAGRTGLAGLGWTGAGRLRVVGAPGSGDDTIAELAGELPGRRLVVTADRRAAGPLRGGRGAGHRPALADRAAGRLTCRFHPGPSRSGGR